MSIAYPDSCVVINAYKGSDRELRNLCRHLLGSSENQILVSDFHRLELLPKPQRGGDSGKDELEFMHDFISNGQLVPLSTDGLADQAIRLMVDFSLKALDALHVAAAILGGAEEFVTAESQGSCLMMVKDNRIRVVTLAL